MQELLAIDIGTTNCKAAIFSADLRPRAVRIAETPVEYGSGGRFHILPDKLWATVDGLIDALAIMASGRIAAIGVTSMAESGLILDRASGRPRSVILPWADRSSAPYAGAITATSDPVSLFSRMGIHVGFKNSLAKILCLRHEHPETIDEHSVWLSLADFIAQRLTGAFSTDFSLAGRTAAFDLTRKAWNYELLESLELPPTLLPSLLPATSAAGLSRGLPRPFSGDVPVAVAGHDHICAAIGSGCLGEGNLLDSMGTAEVLLGVMPERSLGEKEYQSGLTFGLLPVDGRMYWLGGLSASGASVEWLRGIIAERVLEYADLAALVATCSKEPGDVIYVPYLSGAGSPWPSPDARGAFLGLKRSHRPADLVKAVLEGTACQMEAIRRAAAELCGLRTTRIVASGGGSRNRHWLTIKSQLCGLPLEAPHFAEAALRGAAVVAGVAAGVFVSCEEAAARIRDDREVVEPDPSLHELYEAHLRGKYLPVAAFVRNSSKLWEE